jgi:hypothetical protein
MLEGFDDADHAESPEEEDRDHVFVSEEVSVAAIAAAVGMSHPVLNPWMLTDDDEEPRFRSGRWMP